MLVYSNKNENEKRYKARSYYLPKGVIRNYNIIINGKNFYDQPTDSDIKRYEEIRKLTTGEDGDYTTKYLLHYGYIKNHYRIIVVDLSKQKELDADPKDAADTGNGQSMFVLTNLEKIKETRLTFS